MSSLFLSGVLSAWTAAHFGLAIFFALAYLLGRRERESLLFCLLCALLSVLTGGLALDLAGHTLLVRYRADQITHTAAILAAIINLDFALSFAYRGRARLLLAGLYVVAFGFVALDWLGALWVQGSYRIVKSYVFGLAAEHAIGEATPAGIAYYVVGSLETIAATFALWVAYRQGKREVLPALVGAAAALGALFNDVGLALGRFENTIALLPHFFLLYAFGAGGTLLFRYRVVRGQLEETASSLQQRTEELRNSYAELAQVQSELTTKRQLAIVGELAAAIAHEVRNPLAVIVNAVSGLRRTGIRDQDRMMLLNIVDEEAGRLNRLVTDLLRFARPVSVKRSPVSLVELANRCRATVADGFEVRVRVTGDSSVQTVDVDPTLFRLVFDNLVSNACQAMGDSGTVEVSIGGAELSGEPAARIEIRDSGHGMEAHVLERALDPFFTTRPSGTGLGLPIVHRIVEAHGGELLLDSQEGRGTRVILVVPVHPVQETPVPRASA